VLKHLSIFILCSLLIACSTTQTTKTTKSNKHAASLNYIDLSSDQYKTRGTDEYWTVLTRTNPNYPIDAARKGISGCVNLVVGINSEGKMQGYKIKSSYPPKIFDNAAAAAIKKWQWKATKKNSALQPILTSIRLDFSVHGASYNPKYEKYCPTS